jgi:hypothetical protein
VGYHTYQTNLTAGILSPYLFSRADFKKYPNGAEDLYNTVVKVSGGGVRRAGTMFVARAKSTNAFQPGAFQSNAFQMNAAFQAGGSSTPASVLLVPFIFNTREAYMLEFGDKYIRFYKNRQQILASGTGTELVTNGNFDTDLTGWTLQQDNGATVTWTPQSAVLSPGGAPGLAGISQALTGLVAGATYVLNYTVGDNITFSVGTTLGQQDIVADTPLTAGTYRTTFVAPDGNAVLRWRSTTANTDNILDSVSMKAAVELELPTNYTANQLRSLRFAQSGDVLYICHPSHPIRKLIRLSDILWTIQDVVLSPPPTEEAPLAPSTTLTPGATVGQGVNFHAGFNPTFLAADINRQIKSQGGVAVITAFVDGDDVTADIISPFLSTNPIGAGLWSLDGSPYSNATLGLKGPVNTVTSITLTTPGFRSTDVGKFILALDGMGEITNVASDTVATIRILVEFSGTALTAGAWTLESESFSSDLGFPDVPVFFEQRLWFMKGNTVHGSVSGDFENFAGGSNDDDAVEFPIAGRVDNIRWAKALKNFVVGAIGSEYKLDGGDNNAITPTNIHAAPQTDWGCDPEPDAITAGKAALFIQRGRQNIREMAFDFASDAFDSADICILADHLFGSGIVQLFRCSSPDSFVGAVMDDGTINLATYERKEDVVAWGRLFGAITDGGAGKFVSGAVIPAKCGTGDEIWVAVRRQIGTRTDVFIEVFDGQLNTDCALVNESDDNTLSTTFTGFNHLANQTVDIIKRGQSAFQKNAFQMGAFQAPVITYQTAQMDGTGSVEVDAPGATRIEVGLHYNSLIKTLRPDPAGQRGTSHFQKKRSNTVYVRFFCTKGDGVKVNSQLVPKATIEAAEVTDYLRESNLGWDRDGTITIEQTQPFPMTVLGVAYSWQVSDGDAP